MGIREAGQTRPRAREEGLVVRQLLDEVVVYDLERHKAYCLSLGVASIWRRCDGRTTPAAIVRSLQKTLPAGEEAVWIALERLSRARLLQEPVSRPMSPAEPSRRRWMKKTAVLAGLSVISIAVPSADYAASCITSAACRSLPNNQCPGLPCCDGPGAGRPCTKQANGPLCSCGGL